MYMVIRQEISQQLIVPFQDMVAFSCCIFDGGDNEKKQLDVAREKGWRGKFTRPGRVIRPGAIRMNGECPLTPLKVCLYLKDDVSAWKEASGIYLYETFFGNNIFPFVMPPSCSHANNFRNIQLFPTL